MVKVAGLSKLSQDARIARVERKLNPEFKLINDQVLSIEQKLSMYRKYRIAVMHGFYIQKHFKESDTEMYLDLEENEWQNYLTDSCISQNIDMIKSMRLNHKPIESSDYSITIEYFRGNV